MRRGQRRLAHRVIGDRLAGAAVGDDLALMLAAGATSAPPCRAPSSRSTPPRPSPGTTSWFLTTRGPPDPGRGPRPLTLRSAGSAHISDHRRRRWLSPAFGRNAEFTKTRLQRDFDSAICPVTVGTCP